MARGGVSWTKFLYSIIKCIGRLLRRNSTSCVFHFPELTERRILIPPFTFSHKIGITVAVNTYGAGGVQRRSDLSVRQGHAETLIFRFWLNV
ncbi:hypothetical protein Nepgr_000692 [Nepenthes gracilis]|uniref:Uncharacterized protein n=1 Tax=Nepenthes gracilis TaxID=150966 RepID=A0AAD3P5Q9_NEPGR|nr:hypothetical protein Nepgr_000692 [Nepenthes gracilis]